MGSPVDLTLGRCSSESPSSKNGYRQANPRDHLRESAQEHLCTLREERRKVEGFKRELPLCIELLDEGKLGQAKPHSETSEPVLLVDLEIHSMELCVRSY